MSSNFTSTLLLGRGEFKHNWVNFIFKQIEWGVNIKITVLGSEYFSNPWYITKIHYHLLLISHVDYHLKVLLIRLWALFIALYSIIQWCEVFQYVLC